VRIVHLGLGNFARAHQASYTDRAPDANEWGIAAFTGRKADLAEAMAPQDGLFTMVTKTVDGDQFDVVSSISEVHSADEHEAWLGYFASTDLSIITLTVTEAGYVLGSGGDLDADNDKVVADVAALLDDPIAVVRTAPGRLVAGFLARRASGGGAITVVPCDNLPENGAVVSRVVGQMAELVDPSLAGWIALNVSWVTTVVDRITPEATDQDRVDVLAATGVDDPATVVTEPFAEWVLTGSFPTGRPAWDRAGARIVEDVVPFEERKLWLLNGAHSLLAYAASIRGHQTVAEAIADPVALGWVEEWWDEASRHLRLPAEELTLYRAALLERFANPHIRHLLAQIAADGSQKISVRILPTLKRERAAGRSARGAARVVAAWTCHLRGAGAVVTDVRADELAPLGAGSLEESVTKVLTFLGIDDRVLGETVLAQARELTT